MENRSGNPVTAYLLQQNSIAYLPELPRLSVLVTGEQWGDSGDSEFSRQEDVKKSISLKFRLNRNVCRRPSGHS